MIATCETVTMDCYLGCYEEGPIQQVENPAKQAMTQVRLVTIDEAVLVSRQGERRAIRGSIAPVVDDGGVVLSAVLVFHEVASGGHGPQRPDERGDALRKVEEQLAPPQGSSICAPGEWYDLATFIAERSAIKFNGGLCPECMDHCFPCDGKHP